MKNQDEKGKHGGDSENKAQRRQPGTKMAASGAPDIAATARVKHQTQRKRLMREAIVRTASRENAADEEGDVEETGAAIRTEHIP